MIKTNAVAGKWTLTLILLLTAALSLTSLVDQRAGAEYEKLFQRALVTFALARSVNGIISVVQGTEIALQPAGVGVTLTPGQILDPVNDLVERFSWIMMAATVSLGIQNVLLDISSWWVVQLLAAVFCTWTVVRLWYPEVPAGVSGGFLKRVLVALLFVRFAVPVMLIANDLLYQQFLEVRYQQSTQLITAAGRELEQLGAETQAESPVGTDSGLLDSISQALSSTFSVLDISGKLERMQMRAAEVVEHVVQLSVVFVLQTGLLPVAFLWVLLQLVKRLFRLESSFINR